MPQLLALLLPLLTGFGGGAAARFGLGKLAQSAAFPRLAGLAAKPGVRLAGDFLGFGAGQVAGSALLGGDIDSNDANLTRLFNQQPPTLTENETNLLQLFGQEEDREEFAPLLSDLGVI